MSRPTPPTYKTRNWRAHSKALKRRGSLTIWFDPTMTWETGPTGKHGGTKRRVWRKIHIGIDKQTMEIRATGFTTNDVGDAPMLPELLDQIPPGQEIASVTAEAAQRPRCTASSSSGSACPRGISIVRLPSSRSGSTASTA